MVSLHVADGLTTDMSPEQYIPHEPTASIHDVHGEALP